MTLIRVVSLPALGLSSPRRLLESAESAHSSGQCLHSAVAWAEGGRGVTHTHVHTSSHTLTYTLSTHTHTHMYILHKLLLLKSYQQENAHTHS